jgi:exodeoxyribonuclease VII large subunit
MSEVLSLYELNQLIRSVIDESLPGTFLVTAEIASCDVKNHCYLTLVDKEEDTIRAEIRAVIWANRYKAIAPVFEESTGTRLAKGIKILFQAAVSFHERYGLKLTINNIDPSYTLGEFAVKRKEKLRPVMRI